MSCLHQKANMGNKSGLSNPTFLLVSLLLCLFLGFGTIAIASFPTLALYALVITGFGGLDVLRYITVAIVGAVLVIALLSYIGYPIYSKGKLNNSASLLAILIISIVLCVSLNLVRYK